MAAVTGADLRVLQVSGWLETFWTSKSGRACARVGTAIADDQSRCVVAVSLLPNYILQTALLNESGAVLDVLLESLPTISIKENMMQVEYVVRINDLLAHEAFIKASTRPASTPSAKRFTFGSEKRFKTSEASADPFQ